MDNQIQVDAQDPRAQLLNPQLNNSEQSVDGQSDPEGNQQIKQQANANKRQKQGGKQRSSLSQRNPNKLNSGMQKKTINGRKLVSGRPDKEQRFYSVSILKLTKSFERQFFNLKPKSNNIKTQPDSSVSVEQQQTKTATNNEDISSTSINNQEPTQKQSKAAQQQQLREEHKEYFQRKDQAIRSLAHIHFVAWFMLFVGIVLLICEIVSIFSYTKVQGFFVWLAVLTCPQTSDSDNENNLRTTGTTSVTLFTSFTIGLLYLLQASFAFYTYQAKNCDCAIIFHKESLISLFALIVLQALSVTFGAKYTSNIELCEKSQTTTGNNQLQNLVGPNPNDCDQGEDLQLVGNYIVKYYLAYDLSLIFVLVLCQLFALRLSVLAKQRFCQLHQYLMNYKMSPTSRIFKRHKPNMEAVMEVASALERSQTLTTNNGYNDEDDEFNSNMNQTIEDELDEEFARMSQNMKHSTRSAELPDVNEDDLSDEQ